MNNKIIIAALILMTLIPATLLGQSRKERRLAREAREAEVIDSILSIRRYRFVAENLYSPVVTRNTTLNSRYDLTVTKDSIISYLPYAGKLYSPMYPDNESPLVYTSTDFTYSASPSRKNSVEIVIEAKTRKSAHPYKMYITIFPNGSSFLQVMNSDKTSISFSGYTVPIVY